MRMALQQLLPRYVMLTVIRFTVLVWIIIVGVDFFILLLGELQNIGQGDYDLWQALLYAIYTLPNSQYQLFPMVVLLGNLVGLGTLGNNAELLIMRAAGMSVWQITRYAMIASLALLLVMMIIGEGVAPQLQYQANQNRLIAESGGKSARTAQGLWLKKDQSFIHINEVSHDHRLHDITVYQFDKHLHLKSIWQAKQAYPKYRNRWQLQDVEITNLSDKGTTAKHFDKTFWKVDLNNRLLGNHVDQDKEMTIWSLYHFIQASRDDGLAVIKPRLDLYQRLLKPISALVMVLLAVPFIFGPLRTVTMGVRIVTGCVFGFAFYLLNEFFGPFSLVYQVPPLLGASLPTLVFLMIAGILLSRVR